MEFIPSMKVERRSIGADGPERAAALHEERLIALSSWMMILGTIRVICTFADLVGAFLDSTRFQPISTQMLSNFVDENQPFLALGVFWPLFLGIVVRRTRWPELLPAAGVSFLILSIGGVLEALAEWNRASVNGVTFGSLHLTRFAFLKPTFSDVILALLGAGQLSLEFATAVRCLLLSQHRRGSRVQTSESGKQESARRARLGRLAIYASVCFLMLMIRVPVWSTYIEIINDSTIVREFVLRTELVGRSNRRSHSPTLSQEERRTRELRQLLSVAFASTNDDNVMEAKEAYLELITRAESAAGGPSPAAYDNIIAQAHNNVAWLLATCAKTEMRDPGEAVTLARVAVKIEPATGNYWNTLGVALYRDGDWDEAKESFARSMALRGDGGDSFDWFFLAIIHFKQGRKQQAVDLYGKAVQWFENSAPADRELYRFQVEAARELGLPRPAMHRAVPPGRNARQPIRFPGGPTRRGKRQPSVAAPRAESAE